MADAQTTVGVDGVGEAFRCVGIEPLDAAGAIRTIAVRQVAGEVGRVWADVACTTGIAAGESIVIQLCVEVLAHGWGIVIDVDGQAAIDRIAVGVGHLVVQGEGLVVLIRTGRMPECSVLRDAVGAGGAVEGDGDHGHVGAVLILADAQSTVGVDGVGEARRRAAAQPFDVAWTIGTVAVAEAAAEVSRVWADVASTTGIAAR